MTTLDGLELRHLVALRAVADSRSFGQAADRLGYTQSAVSQQIAALERVLGARVFDRPGGRGAVTLTPVGRTLLEHADIVLARVEQAGRDVDDLLAGRAGRIRVGTFESASVRLLPAIVGRLRGEHPDVDIVLHEDNDVRRLLDAVADDALDVSFVVGPVVDERVQCEWVGDDPFVVVAPVAAPPAPMSPRELGDVPLIGQSESSCQTMIEEALRGYGVDARYVFRSSDNGAVQAMVRAGLGHAVMPRLAVRLDDPEVVVRELEPPIPPRAIGLAWRAAATLAPAAARFVEIACDVSAAVLADA